jgi:hypothetical protein
MAAIVAELAQAGAWVSDRASVNHARNELGLDDFEDDEIIGKSGEPVSARADS